MNRMHVAQLSKKKNIRVPFVKIGTQYWTSRNYAETVTIFGTPITNVTDNTIWGSSQTLYTNKYNERIGLGDTVEQATYTALKVSAFWCDYNNLPANGLIYGHLYNWFAVKLIQMDIDYYNAQLLATYGYTPEYYARRYDFRIPTQAEFNTLATFLGGAGVAGAKMKQTGTTNWIAPNTGATNESGFNGIGGGRRLSNGGFEALKEISEIVAINNFYYLHASASPTQLTNDGFLEIQKRWGCSLRQIKA